MARITLRGRSPWPSPWRGLLCIVFSSSVTSVGAQETPTWDLAEVLETAASSSPVLLALSAELRAGESRLRTARIFPHNPEVTVEIGDRSGVGGSSADRSVSIAQTLEWAAARRERVARATGGLAAARADVLHRGRLVAYRVASAFVDAVRDRELLGVAETDADLARQMLAFSERRLARGVATQIEVNLVQASTGRAERTLERARAAYASSRIRLAELAGVGAAEAPEPAGVLAFPETDALPPLAELQAQARAHRADLDAFRGLEAAADADVGLARAKGRPHLTVGASYAREEGTDDIFSAALTVSLPLFNRHQGRIAEARAERQRLGHERVAQRLAIEREVATARSLLEASRSAAQHLRDQVVGTLEENVDLLQRSFAAGRIDATEVVTLRREFVSSRREYVEALADAWQARFDLERATGRLALPGGVPGGLR